MLSFSDTFAGYQPKLHSTTGTSHDARWLRGLLRTGLCLDCVRGPCPSLMGSWLPEGYHAHFTPLCSSDSCISTGHCQWHSDMAVRCLARLPPACALSVVLPLGFCSAAPLAGQGAAYQALLSRPALAGIMRLRAPQRSIGLCLCHAIVKHGRLQCMPLIDCLLQ